MKYCGSLIVVEDMARSVAFYKRVFNARVIVDYGANVTLTGGYSLQTRETWTDFIEKNAREIVYGGNDAELYFEEEDFDAFVERLDSLEVDYVHPVKRHDWGQRTVRLYDPDRHIIEIGESMDSVVVRYLREGLTPEEINRKTMVQLGMIRRAAKKAGIEI